MQPVFVGLAMIPVPALGLLLIIELTYMVAITVPYLKHKHLKSLLLWLPKIAQSLLLLGIESMLLLFYLKLEDVSLPLKRSSQKIITSTIFVSNMLEYIFLILNIYLLIKLTLAQKKRIKTDKKYQKHIESKNSALVYKDPLSSLPPGSGSNQIG